MCNYFAALPRGVELTDAGSALLADARAILSHIDHAFATTKRTARGEQGTNCGRIHEFGPLQSLRAAHHSRVPGSVSRWCR